METVQLLTKLTPDITLAHLILVDPKAAEMLASIGLDPAEHKEETLRSVCKQRQWSEVEVLQWIKNHRQEANVNYEEEDPKQEPDFGNDVLKWANYIEEELHAKNAQLLNEISDDFPRVHQIHGNQYPWLKDIKWYFNQFEEALRIYCKFERKKFYPLVRKLNDRNQEILDGTVRELQRSITIIKDDQTQLQLYMSTIREKGHNFENPAGACTTLRILNQNFKVLFSDLDTQFKIEKETLLPLLHKKLDVS